MKQLALMVVAAGLLAGLTVLDARPAHAANCSSVCNQIRRACRSSAQFIRTGDLALCDGQVDTCRADCGTDPACTAVCTATRASCRTDARNAQQDRNAACNASRETCRGVCVEPIDRSCSQVCKAERRTCDRDAKSLERGCKKSCGRGEARRACLRDCRARESSDARACSDNEVLCLARCAGLTLAP